MYSSYLKEDQYYFDFVVKIFDCTDHTTKLLEILMNEKERLF